MSYRFSDPSKLDRRAGWTTAGRQVRFVLSFVVLVLLSSGGAAEDQRILDASIPHIVDARPGVAASIAILSPTDISETAGRVARSINRRTDKGASLTVLRIRSAPLTSRNLSDAEVAELQKSLAARHGRAFTPAQATAAYDQNMAAFLAAIVGQIHDWPISVYGLPLEGPGASQINQRFHSVIAEFDVLVSSKKVILASAAATESDLAAQAMPNAFASRGNRAVLFQTNGIWRTFGGDGAFAAGHQTDHASWTATRRSASRSTTPPIAETSSTGSHQSGPGSEMKSEADDGGEGHGDDRRRAGFDFHWSVRGAFADELELGDLPVKHDVALFYAYELGLHPWIKDGETRNGGMPQTMDMAAHLAELPRDIAAQIPDAGYSGFAVIDYEEFPFYWSALSDEYKNFSRNLVRARVSGLSENEVEQRASLEYENATKAFYLATLRRAKELRPHAKWGYFLNIFVFSQEESIDQLAWLWSEVDMVCPTIYIGKYGLPREESIENNSQTFANSTKARLSQRIQLCRGLVGEAKIVMPYLSWRYHVSNDLYGLHPLNDLDLQTELAVGYESGADGVIVWDKLHTREDAQLLQSELDNRVGLAIRALLDSRPQ